VTATLQLLAFRFDATASYEGRLIGALERTESGGALRVVEVLFVARDPGTAELTAVSARGRGQGSLVASLLGFRLDPGERKRMTDKARRAFQEADGSNGLDELAERLPAGGAIAAVLVEHRWAEALNAAVGEMGGSDVAGEFVDATELKALLPRLLAAASPGS
jgi:hypothetical protein